MPTDETGNLVPKIIGVRTVATNELVANPHNPRMLFDKEPMTVLESSIKKVGILVPLTVYRSKAKNAYVILDGQRRWICAKNVGLPTVPVNEVEEPTLVQNIVTMFQIHKLREDWELMPTALKVELLMSELKEKADKRLATLTGLDQAVVIRCKKLLSYPKKFQDLMLNPEPSQRIKSDFFIELYAIINDRTVVGLEWFTKNQFTQRMLDKHHKKAGIKSVTDFRVMKQHISNARRVNKIGIISKRLREFSENDSLTIDHLEIKSAAVHDTAKKITRSIGALTKTLEEIEIEDYYGEEEFWTDLEKLMRLIRTKLLAAGRRIK
jgi:ParB/RepB/Spo0J family partition protein